MLRFDRVFFWNQSLVQDWTSEKVEETHSAACGCWHHSAVLTAVGSMPEQLNNNANSSYNASSPRRLRPSSWQTPHSFLSIVPFTVCRQIRRLIQPTQQATSTGLEYRLLGALRQSARDHNLSHAKLSIGQRERDWPKLLLVVQWVELGCPSHWLGNCRFVCCCGTSLLVSFSCWIPTGGSLRLFSFPRSVCSNMLGELEILFAALKDPYCLLRHYHCPPEQRQMSVLIFSTSRMLYWLNPFYSIRILYMPPVYAIISFFSYRFFRSYTYYELIEVSELVSFLDAPAMIY